MVTNAAPVAYTTNAPFLASLGAYVFDGYDAAGYQAGDALDLPDFDVHSTTHMNSESTRRHAYVVFGDGSSVDYLLETIGNGVFAVTSDKLIASMHLGGLNGASITNGSYQQFDVTIGSAPVPLPAAAWLAAMRERGQPKHLARTEGHNAP